MKVIFLGVGEAFDENLPNNSHLVTNDTVNILLDCGYSVPPQLWKFNNDQSFLDAIYISHMHADHYFGIPPLLVRMYEEERKKDLVIICQESAKELINQYFDYGYKGFRTKFKFKINFIEVDPEKIIDFKGFKLSFAPTKHSSSNLAIKITDKNGKSVCYSGDGRANKKTERLYKNSDLVIHESYLERNDFPGHGSIIDLIEIVKRNNIKCLALTHIQRDFRKKNLKRIKQLISKENVNIIIPEPLDEYKLES